MRRRPQHTQTADRAQLSHGAMWAHYLWRESEALESPEAQLEPGPRSAVSGSTAQTGPTETVRTEVIGMDAVDNQAFLRWLHRKSLRAELLGIALLVVYWLVQIYQCEEEDGTVEMVVTAIVVCALVSRAASGLANSRLPAQLPLYLSIPHHWDGAIWSMLVVLAHGVEASTIAFGSHSRAAAIAWPRLVYTEAAHGVCLLVGMVRAHPGPRPPRR